MSGMRTFLGQLSAMWLTWPLGRRLSVVLGTVLGVGTLLGLIYLGSQVSFVPLMSNLSPEDAASLVAALERDHVPYRLADGGSALMVPEAQVHKLRLKMAGDGLPKGGGVGFEIFENTSLGMSRFAEQVNYRRALEGELQRTIRTLDSVRDARVHIATAERTLFREQRNGARASVTVHLHRGRRLSGEQVQAIVHLVASSVPDLAPDDVTIIDSAGGVLARGGDAAHATGAAFDEQLVMERALEDRVTEILERTIGVGKVSVRAALTLDATRIEKTTESFDPDGAVLRSEQSSSEQHAAPTQKSSGIPGARSNLSGVASSASISSISDVTSTHVTQTKNYEITKVVSHEVRPTSRVQRLSVAVLIDDAPTMVDGQPGPKRTAEDVARLTDLVRKAVGFDESRGDQVVVQSAPFQSSEMGAADSREPPTWLPWVERLWRPVVVVLAIVLLAIFVVGRRRGAAPLPQEIFAVPRTVRQLEAAMATPDMLATSADPAAALPSRLTDPNRAAAVLKGWLEGAP